MSKEDFYDLTPDEVMNAVESAGFSPTGEFTQLNSYENRVFDVRLENKDRVIAKFYRPGRWSKETILEEHEFLLDLKSHGWPAVAPLKIQNKGTLANENGIWFALWPKAMGRQVEELQLTEYEKLGRTLAHIHNVGEQKKAKHRPHMNVKTYGWQNLDILNPHIAPEVRHRYLAAAEAICSQLEENLDEKKFIRIHGDCHKGNILKTDSKSGEPTEFFFIDFDDFCMGHPIQDFWMLLSAPENTDEGAEELDALARGYAEFRHFDDDWYDLIAGLRGLRIINYAAWIARRWEDPTFPRLFPQYTEFNYWAAETEALEKIAQG